MRSLHPKYIFTCILFLLCSGLHANSGHREQVVNGLQGIMITYPSTITVSDQHFSCLTPTNNCDPGLRLVGTKVYPKLWFDDSSRGVYNDWDLEVRYDIALTDDTGYTFTLYDKSLSINFRRQGTYRDIDYELLSAYWSRPILKAKLTVRSVTRQGFSGPITSDVKLDVVIESEKYYLFDKYNLSPIVNYDLITGHDKRKNELEIFWNYVHGAESYDVEWLFIDCGTDTGFSRDYSYDFNNATRINTTNNHFNISLAYPNGLLLFRARARGAIEGYEEGVWSADQKGVLIANDNHQFEQRPNLSPQVTPVVTQAFRFGGMDRNKNWQYSVSYAENGLHKEVAQYYDGAGHQRQTVTQTNSNNLAIIGQNHYDFTGRLAASTLPAPLTSSGIHYYDARNASDVANAPTGTPENLSRNANGDAYSYRDFDLVSNPAQVPSAAPMSAILSTGAAKYYSPQNTIIGIGTDYIPDSEGYPITHTIYSEDGTDRVLRQSGVGPNHQIHSGHETRYLYALPGSQVELDRLFGNNVGDVMNYKKNFVIDPNGQISVSYLDGKGRTIATALSGKAENLLDIDTRPAQAPQLQADLTDFDRRIDQTALSVAKVMAVTSGDDYTFNYSIPAEIFNDCGSVECTYELTIYIIEEASGNKVQLTNITGTNYSTSEIITETINTSFSTSFQASLQFGTYLIVKELKLDETALDVAVDNFISYHTNTQGTCYDFIPPPPIISCNDCRYDCEDHYVQVDLLTQERSFLNELGEVVAVFPYDPISQSYPSAPANSTSDWPRIECLISQCVLDCETEDPLPSPCEETYENMLADMSPGGQYFDNLPEQNNSGYDINGWLNSAENTMSIASFSSSVGMPSLTSWELVRNNWEEEWAAILVEKAHPEYCLFTSYCCVTEDKDELTGISTWEIEDLDFLNCGRQFKEILTLRDTIAAYQDFNGTGCTLPQVVFPANDQSQCFTATHPDWDTFHGTNGILGSGPEQIAPADFFDLQNQQFVEQAKYYYALDQCPNNSFLTPHPENANLTPDSFYIHFPTLDWSGDIIDQQDDICQDICEASLDGWVQQFSCIDNLSPADSISLRLTLLTICNNSCINDGQPDDETSVAVSFVLDIDGNAYSATTFAEVAHIFSQAYGLDTLACPVPTFPPVSSEPNSSDGLSYTPPNQDSLCTANYNARQMEAAQRAYDDMLLERAAEWRNALIEHCMANAENREEFNYDYILDEYHYTLYFHDAADNLVQTVSPNGVYQEDKNGNVVYDVTDSSRPEGNNTSQSIAYRDDPNNPAYSFQHPRYALWTNYKYNSLQQLVEQNTPDGGKTIFFYNPVGQLVASQNAHQASLGNVYSVTVYDDLARIIEVKELEVTQQLTNEIARELDPVLSYNSWLSTTNTERYITRTYYDEQQASLGVPITQENLRNRIASITYDANGDGAHESGSHFDYDISGNVKTLIQEDIGLELAGNRFTQIEYDFERVSGNVKLVSYQRGKPEQFYHTYHYDADGRLLCTYTSRDSIIWELEEKRFYLPHGPVARSEIGDLQVQGIDYAYTLHGWLKAINSSMGEATRDMGADGIANTINQKFGRDAFGMSLHYYDGDYKVTGTGANTAMLASISNSIFDAQSPDLFNGNISKIIQGQLDENEQVEMAAGKGYAYDVLNRLKHNTNFVEQSNAYARQDNDFSRVGNAGAFDVSLQYDGNGNIETLERHGGFVQQDMDEFNYIYELSQPHKTNNRLRKVEDNPAFNTYYDNDLDHQIDPNNYAYDELGRLIQDLSEEIALIEWNAFNKITAIRRTPGSSKPTLIFLYDAFSKRRAKVVSLGGIMKITHYTRDASGNILATYGTTFTANGFWDFTIKTDLNEFHLYGSKRLGIKKENYKLFSNSTTEGGGNYLEARLSQRTLGSKQYELSNHLGNVMEIISDRKLIVSASVNVDYYTSAVQSYIDYYPFGMQLSSRSSQINEYRFGFNGMETDSEVFFQEGNSYDFGARILDTRIGRWLSTDPLAYKYPGFSRYIAMANNPIAVIDPDGRDIWIFNEDGSWTYTQAEGNDRFYTKDADGNYDDILSLSNTFYGLLPFVDVPMQDLNQEFDLRPEAWALLQKTNPTMSGALKYTAAVTLIQNTFDAATAIASIPSLVKGVFKGGKFLFQAVKNGKTIKGSINNGGDAIINGIRYSKDQFKKYISSGRHSFKRLNIKVRSMQKGKLSRSKVNEWKQKLLDGTFDNAREAIGVKKNVNNGKTFINEGNHRFQAAKEIFEETGDRTFIDDLLKNARTTNIEKNPVDNFPLRSVGN